MPEVNNTIKATVSMGFDLAEQYGEDFILAITAAYKAGIEMGMQISAQTAPPAA